MEETPTKNDIFEDVKHGCSQCGKHFKLQKSLRRHIKTVHEGIKFACNECGKQFADPSCLIRHIKSAHEQ